MPSVQEPDFVFLLEDGKALHPDYVSKPFQKLVARTGLPPVRLL